MRYNINEIVKIGNEKIKEKGWKIYSDDIKYYGQYVRLFYQSKQLVETGISREDDDDMIYGIGIFLVNLDTMKFHNVNRIEDIDRTVKELTLLY